MSARLSNVVLPPESGKRQIEDRDLVLTTDQERAARVIHLVLRTQVDVRQRFGELGETSGMHVDARAPQDTAEDQQIVEETRHPGT